MLGDGEGPPRGSDGDDEGRQNYNVLMDPVVIYCTSVTHARHILLSRIAMDAAQC